jgi:putative DNA primase/helicase
MVNGDNIAMSTQLSENKIILYPVFEDLNNPDTIKNHLRVLTATNSEFNHQDILTELLNQVQPIDYQLLVFPEVAELRNRLIDSTAEENTQICKELTKRKVARGETLVLTIENIRNMAEKNDWGLCKNLNFIYVYNGAYWSIIEPEALQKFLGESAEKMGVKNFTAKHYLFRDQLSKQFLATEYLPKPEHKTEAVFINLKNGTFEITTSGTKLRNFKKEDFLTYQLPFDYKADAQAPIFKAYLDRVLPDKERQYVLAEYLGSVFIKNGSKSIKEEKALILYGSGANGKSVFFEIVNALLGDVNISSYSLQNLTDGSGYYRAMIANKLVNYASEINGKLETSTFKQMVSGEPIEARLPYGNPMQIRQYAKLIFNANELPRDVEQTPAYFRRFLIIPFDVTIPENEQDKELHIKIIEAELSGIFNWVLTGLKRLLEQKRFSRCEAATQAVDQYKKEADSVNLFIDDENYQKSTVDFMYIKELFVEYRYYCMQSNFREVSKINFSKRLKNLDIKLDRKNSGNVAYLTKTPVA